MNKKPQYLQAHVEQLSVDQTTGKLLGEICFLIETARNQIARAANSGVVSLYWNIGDRIGREILGDQRAEYGKKIVYALSIQLTMEYGRGFSDKALFQMMRFV